jgi:tetratricopeptide (TPR) repeat protein
VWNAPIPIVGLAADWHLLWHQYQFALGRCDLVVTDNAGVAVLGQAGFSAFAANLFGCARSFFNESKSQTRDIDVLYVGSLHPAEQRDRLPWLRRVVLAAGDRWKVRIRSAASRGEYLELLRRSRILFNRSVRGECNLRVFEAAATGPLLFQEIGNREVGQYLQDGTECVFYAEDTLETLLKYYLENEGERARIAAAAKQRSPEFSFDSLWERIVCVIEQRMEALACRAAERSNRTISIAMEARLWESLNSSTRPHRAFDLERRLIDDLQRMILEQPQARLYNMLGLALARRGQREGAFNRTCTAECAAKFRRAVELRPESLLFRLNFVESLWHIGSNLEAIEECRRALNILERTSDLNEGDLCGGHFPPAFDTFRIEWERSAWRNAGDRNLEVRDKIRLLGWRLHSLMGALSNELHHYRRAVSLRDDLWVSHAALGRALLRSGACREAATYLRRAHELNPFDDSLTGDLLEASRMTRDTDGECRLIAERRLMQLAAGMNAPTEIRFTQEVTKRGL